MPPISAMPRCHAARKPPSSEPGRMRAQSSLQAASSGRIPHPPGLHLHASPWAHLTTARALSRHPRRPCSHWRPRACIRATGALSTAACPTRRTGKNPTVVQRRAASARTRCALAGTAPAPRADSFPRGSPTPSWCTVFVDVCLVLVNSAACLTSGLAHRNDDGSASVEC